MDVEQIQKVVVDSKKEMEETSTLIRLCERLCEFFLSIQFLQHFTRFEQHRHFLCIVRGLLCNYSKLLTVKKKWRRKKIGRIEKTI